MKKRNVHQVEVIMHDARYMASELNNVITLHKDGEEIGKGRWKDDQIVESTAVLHDDIVHALEKKIVEQIKINWGED